MANRADVRSVGIPRALLYHRYGTLWETFFHELGREVVLSRETDRALVDEGSALSVDECCLASKAYLGHAASLVGACDALFVPSMGNMGHHLGFCTKFQALPDLVENTLRDRNVRVASCLVDVTEEHMPMREAFLDLASRFGANPREAKRAWKTAFHEQERADRAAAGAQERLLTSLAPAKTRVTLSTKPSPSASMLTSAGTLLSSHCPISLARACSRAAASTSSLYPSVLISPLGW